MSWIAVFVGASAVSAFAVGIAQFFHRDSDRLRWPQGTEWFTVIISIAVGSDSFKRPRKCCSAPLQPTNSNLVIFGR